MRGYRFLLKSQFEIAPGSVTDKPRVIRGASEQSCVSSPCARRLADAYSPQSCQIARSRLCTQTRSSPPPPSASSTRATPRATGRRNTKAFCGARRRTWHRSVSSGIPRASARAFRRGASSRFYTSSPSPRWSTQTMRRAARRRPRRPRRPPRRRRLARLATRRRRRLDVDRGADGRVAKPRLPLAAHAAPRMTTARVGACGPMSCVCVRCSMCERDCESEVLCVIRV